LELLLVRLMGLRLLRILLILLRELWVVSTLMLRSEVWLIVPAVVIGGGTVALIVPSSIMVISDGPLALIFHVSLEVTHLTHWIIILDAKVLDLL
jgi:hypothetical protein